jgi:hypothetical protein
VTVYEACKSCWKKITNSVCSNKTCGAKGKPTNTMTTFSGDLLLETEEVISQTLYLL